MASSSLKKRTKERKSKTDGGKREYYNSLFTELQHLLRRIKSWNFLVREGSHTRQATGLDKLRLLLTFVQIEENIKYTNWFITLTIVNIIVLILTASIIFFKS